MKKTVFLVMAALLVPAAANAQLDGLLKKAAQKTVNKTAEKLTDKATDRISKIATDAVDKEVEKRMPSKKIEPASDAAAPLTYEGLMRQLPELPSVDQLVKHKEAELNEKTLKLLTSRVTLFSTKVMELSAQCAAVGLENADSAQMTDNAYRVAEASTGLSRAELDKLAAMSDEEQEAWLKAHYSQQRAETAMTKQALDASKWLEPLQPMIDEWSAAAQKADNAYAEMDSKLKPIYAKYAGKLASAGDKERVNLLLAYYTEAVPHIRTAVQKALNIRLKEQLPIAEKIEAEMAKVRSENPDMINQLLCYPKLTATQYFTETARLVDVPQYND